MVAQNREDGCASWNCAKWSQRKKIKMFHDLKIFVKTLKTLLYTYTEIKNKINILIYLIHYLVYCIWVYILFSTL